MVFTIRNVFFNNAAILLLIATLGHAGNTIAAKLAINDVSPMVIVSFRWGLVASILFFVKKKSIKSSFRMIKKPLMGFTYGRNWFIRL